MLIEHAHTTLAYDVSQVYPDIDEIRSTCLNQFIVNQFYFDTFNKSVITSQCYGWTLFEIKVKSCMYICTIIQHIITYVEKKKINELNSSSFEIFLKVQNTNDESNIFAENFYQINT